eukprot:Clim_evm9s54 gene=Clim_evmTU9s54
MAPMSPFPTSTPVNITAATPEDEENDNPPLQWPASYTAATAYQFNSFTGQNLSWADHDRLTHRGFSHSYGEGQDFLRAESSSFGVFHRRPSVSGHISRVNSGTSTGRETSNYTVSSGGVPEYDETSLLLAKGEETVDAPGRASSTLQATFNGINVLLGVGVLSLPYAAMKAGWILSLTMLFFLAGVTNYTARLLRACIDMNPSKFINYPDLGQGAFGTKGRAAISVAFFLELFTTCAMFLILMSDNLHALFPNVETMTFTLISFLIVLPTSWMRQLSILSYISILGVLASSFLFVALVVQGTTHDAEPGIGGSLHQVAHTRLVGDIWNLPISFGLIMVGYGGHACFPSIYSSMKRPQDYNTMVNITYVVTTVVYAGIMIVGYLMYGDLTREEVTLNMTISGGAMILMSTWLIVISPFSKFSLCLNPVALSIEELVVPVIPEKLDPVFRVFTRTALTSLALVTALYVPYFDRVVAFIGAMFSFFISVTFPCLCYLKLSKDFDKPVPTWERVWCYFLICFSTIATVIGVYGVIV